VFVRRHQDRGTVVILCMCCVH